MISGSDIKIAMSTLSDLVKKGMTIEAQEKIMELREMLLDLREQNVDLRQENAELKGKLEEQDALFFEDGVYWKKKEDGSKDGPFCPACRDKDGKLIRMKKMEYDYYCHICNFEHEHTPHDPIPLYAPPDDPWGNGAW